MSGNGNRTRVVAMSGGVDSSTAAALLAERHPGAVIGLTMQLWDQRRLQDELSVVHAGRCCSLDDAHDARRVANFLGLPYYLVNFESRFEASVVRPFLETYLAGETPIPCTLCNNFIKFDQLLATARQIGAERIATGHYARIRYNDQAGRFELRRAVDESKDQTYFLFGLTQEQLARTEFPLGGLRKQQVRELARARNLPVAEKPESQEICFVPSGNYVEFIEAYLAEQGTPLSGQRGEIVTTEGEVLGEHDGLHRFTLGQRRGLGIAAGKPLYVVALEPERNRVVVGEEAALFRRQVWARDPNWVSVPRPHEPLRAQVKVRHKHEPAPATIYAEDGSRLRLVFDEPQRALTPGQAAVFYAPAEAADPSLVFGGAWLC